MFEPCIYFVHCTDLIIIIDGESPYRVKNSKLTRTLFDAERAERSLEVWILFFHKIDVQEFGRTELSAFFAVENILAAEAGRARHADGRKQADQGCTQQ